MNVPEHTAVSGNWFIRHRRRVAEIGIGHALYGTFNWFFDNMLYVYVVYQLGLLWGGAVMTLLSLLQCAVLLLLYEHMRIDWVGAGSIAELASLPEPTWWQRILIWADRRGTVFIFVALCVFQDPFITTVYFRGGRFDGLKTRDWRTFFASGLLSNGYWTLRSGAVAAIVAGAWHWVTQ